MVKTPLLHLFILLQCFNAAAQDSVKLSLPRAYELALKNYPVTRQKDLIGQTHQLTISNLAKGYLPQLSFNGQASYQSDVTKVDIAVPGITIEAPAKDQYKFTADINQTIFDAGVIKQQQAFQRLDAKVEQDKNDVELYKLKDRINQLYLGILFLDEQLKQIELVKADIQTGIKRVEAQVNNGVAFKSNLNVLKAEWLKTDQRRIELQGSRKGFVQALGLFLNQKISGDIVFERPASSATVAPTINRPEIKLFSSQANLLQQQTRLINAKNLPKAGLFFQGGYGRPGLNLLDNKFDFFYIGGVRLNWALGGLYTQKKEKRLVKLNQQVLDIQKETFLLNTNTQLEQQGSDIEKLGQLVISDKEIIELRRSVKDAAKAQLENSVITANDYLREVNAEDQARQSLISHELQLLQSKINYQTISGNQ